MRIKFKSMLFLLVVLLISGCSSGSSYQNTWEVLTKVMPVDSLKNYDYFVVIPQDGCEGCISFAEEFYESYVSLPQIKFVFTNLISEKKLRKRLHVSESTIIDREGLFLSGCVDSERLYPTVITLKDGKVTAISRQSPDQDALIDLEKIINEEY